ncbi:TRAP transporter small permease subunit [Marinomonas gallaica]|uniref:TRAP transporter small permease subunit n=1 Tax=Marinomonas gallaica TaxID=1806667 RepID=UPI000829C973|nr:TRAP transporter small permease subunit [Marinomonas gallaica]
MSDRDNSLDLAEIEAKLSDTTWLALPQTALSKRIETLIEVIGRNISFVWIVLMVLIVANALMRYFFSVNFIALEELQWHLYAVGFMIGLSYCLIHDGHVRVDAVVEHRSLRTRAWIELIGLSVLLLPFCLIVLEYALPFVTRAYQLNEVSASPGGLPMRWLIKSTIIVAFVLLSLTAFSRWLRCLALVRQPSANNVV